MTPQDQAIPAAIPDLTDTRLDQMAETGTTPLAHSIALYRERLEAGGVPRSSFAGRI